VIIENKKKGSDSMKFNLKKIAVTALTAIVAASGFSAGKTTISASAATSSFDVSKATTAEILDDMTIGWNLGNSLDATGGSGLSSETSWGNPKTTQALIDAVKDQGYNTIRIPVSWGSHMDSDYNIDEEWMNRVKEVVDYAYKDGLYVILNIHHDNMYYSGGKLYYSNGKLVTDDGSYGYYPDSDHKTGSLKFLNSAWSQIAETFKDYDEHLIFETLNEPRLAGTSDEWWIDATNPNAKAKDAVQTINTFNQEIVNTIRKTGSTNKTRLIMCPGYSASIDGAVTSYFKLPTDVSGNKNRIIVSVHGYTPYNFAMNVGSTGVSEYNDNIKSQLNYLFEQLETVTTNVAPVIIGEFGATNKGVATQRNAWVKDYVSKAKALNIVCCIWDNNSYASYNSKGELIANSEYHGIINRTTLKAYDQSYITTMVKAASERSIEGCTITIPTTLYNYDGKAKKPTVTVEYGTKTLKKDTDYTVKYSNNTNAGTATVTITGKGNYTGSVKKTFTIRKLAASKLKFSIDSKKTYTGSKVNAAVTVKYGSKTLKKGTDYTVTYSNNKSIGTAKAKITLKGNYRGTKTLTYTIIPKKETVKKVSAVSKGFKVTYTKQSNVTGYQIQYSTSSKFTSAKTVSVTSYKTTSKTIKSLKAKKTYYVRVRSYKTVNGKKIYGNWSSYKKVTTKK
jgi:endoglucanase